jgi:hypothetical protein
MGLPARKATGATLARGATGATGNRCAGPQGATGPQHSGAGFDRSPTPLNNDLTLIGNRRLT